MLPFQFLNVLYVISFSYHPIFVLSNRNRRLILIRNVTFKEMECLLKKIVNIYYIYF